MKMVRRHQQQIKRTIRQRQASDGKYRQKPTGTAATILAIFFGNGLSLSPKGGLGRVRDLLRFFFFAHRRKSSGAIFLSFFRALWLPAACRQHP